MLDTSAQALLQMATCFLVGCMCHAVFVATNGYARWCKLFLYVGVLCYIVAILTSLYIVSGIAAR